MKKILFSYISLLTLLICFVLPSNAQQAFYIYRNDGTINTFFTTEIDSMTYSRLDLDSVAHEEYVVHEVYTTDRVYRIPIELIDSVGFVTPQTVLQQNVINLADKLYPYIISSDSLTFFLSNSTPTDILPRKNDLLVYMESSTVFPNAFAGKVVDVRYTETNISVECTLVELTEIFRCYYSTSTQENPGNAQIRRSHENRRDTTYILQSPPAQTFDLLPYVNGVGYTPNWPDGIFSINGNANLEVTVATQNKVTVTLIVRDDHPTTPVSINTKFTSSFNLTEDIGLAGTLKLEKDFVAGVPVSTPIPFLNIFVAVGPFIKGEVEISSATTLRQQFSVDIEASMNGHGILTSLPRFYLSDTGHSEDAKIALKGSIGIGAFGELGIYLLNRNFARVNLRDNVYFNIEGDYALNNNDIQNATNETTLYEHLKYSKVSANIVGELKLVGNFTVWDWNKDLIPPVKIPIRTWDLVPIFKDVKTTTSSGSNSKYIAKADIERKPLFPINVGFSLLDESNKVVKTVYDKRTLSSNNFFTNYNLTLSSPDNSKKYSVSPSIKLFGYDILASPSATSSPFQISELKQLSTKYENGTVYAKIKALIEVSSDITPEVLSTYKEYGICIKNNYTGKESYLSVKEIGKKELEFVLPIPKDKFDVVNDNSFTATSNSFAFAAYAVDKDSNKEKDVYSEYPVVYNEAPEISFSSPSVVSTTEETKTDNDGNSVIYYTTICKWNWEDKGSFWVNSVFRKDSHGGQGDTFSPSDGTGTVNYRWTYTASSFREKEIWYEIHLNNEQVMTSTNKILISGSPGYPTISIK